MADTGRTVTIQKAYFEALLRRAEFHASSDEDHVTITKLEYESLIGHASQYNLLCKALYRGGLEPETLRTLLEGETQEQSHESEDFNHWSSSLHRPDFRPLPITSQQHANPSSTPTHLLHPNARNHIPHQGWYGHISPANTTPDKEEPHTHSRSDNRYNEAIPRHAKRTILITGLDENVTLRDLANTIRGGRLVEFYIRNSDRSAVVSFVEGAEDFVSYATRNDIHICGKKINVQWNERQFQIPPHISNKVSTGATRNLLIRGGGATGKLTEQGIREDMEHVHNLAIIEILFKDSDIYVSTNSIYNALFARTCMMSRLPYKGLRIEWYPDECAASLPKPRVTSYHAPRPPHKAPSKAAPVLTNRYNLLSMDVGGSESDSSDSDHLEALSGYGVGLSSNWADMSAVA